MFSFRLPLADFAAPLTKCATERRLIGHSPPRRLRSSRKAERSERDALSWDTSRPSPGKRARRKKNSKENPYPRAQQPVSAKRPSVEQSRSARTVTRSNSRRWPSSARCLPPRKEMPSHANPERTGSECHGVPLPAREENVLRRRRRSADENGHSLDGGESRVHACRAFLVRANAVPDRTRR